MSLCKPVFSSVLPLLVGIMAIVFLIDASRSIYSSDIVLPQVTASQLSLIKNSVIPLKNIDDSQPIVNLINNKPLVLIGDSTHGSHEFYQQRINITKQLILQKNFKSIILEGNWPNTYILNQFVQSLTSLTAAQVLNAYQTENVNLWNTMEMLEFLQWLKRYNQLLPKGQQKVTLHGMDIYSFQQSRQLVIDYLQEYSLLAAQQAKRRYQCFSQFNNNLHSYAQAVKENISQSCEEQVVQQYSDFSNCRIPCPDKDTFIDKEAFFYAQQNARIVKNAEKNYRLLYQSGNDTMSWNERDRHMMETFLFVHEHLNHPNTIIWAHNSHLGDARATEMANYNQLNIGQLLREQYGDAVFSIGMLTYSGTVMAADEWGKPARVKVLLAAHKESNEALFHYLNIPYFLLNLQQSETLSQILNTDRLQRHVGVIYMPQDELASHYTYTHLAKQFNAIIYIDSTTPIKPVP